jgi:hypothetical protein
MAGLHIEGMTPDKRASVFRTEVRKPVPGQHASGRYDNLVTVGGAGLEQRLGGGVQVAVQERCASLVEKAHVHGAGGDLDAAVKGWLCGVASP